MNYDFDHEALLIKLNRIIEFNPSKQVRKKNQKKNQVFKMFKWDAFNKYQFYKHYKNFEQSNE